MTFWAFFCVLKRIKFFRVAMLVSCPALGETDLLLHV